MTSRVVTLPTALVARYRAVNREQIGSANVDSAAHLDALTDSIRREGIRVPLRLEFNNHVAFLDGNDRLAAALRLGLPDVPVELVRRPADVRPPHAQPIRHDDLFALAAALYTGERG